MAKKRHAKPAICEFADEGETDPRLAVRRGRIPREEYRIFKLETGEFEGQPSLDLTLYVQRKLMGSLSLLRWTPETRMALDWVRTNTILTYLQRHREDDLFLAAHEVRRMVKDALPRTVRKSVYELDLERQTRRIRGFQDLQDARQAREAAGRMNAFKDVCAR